MDMKVVSYLLQSELLTRTFIIIHIQLRGQKDINSYSECNQGSPCEKHAKRTVMPLEPTPYPAASVPQMTYSTNIRHFWVILTSWEWSLVQILVTFPIPRATLNRVLPEKPVFLLLTEKFLGFYKTLRLSTLILFSHPRPGLPNGLLPSGFPTKILCAPFPFRSLQHAQPISFVSIWSPE